MNKRQPEHNYVVWAILLGLAIILFVGIKNSANVGGRATEMYVTPTLYAPECYDTDGGRVITTYGIVSGRRSDGSSYRYDDSCQDAQTLSEWYCQDGSPQVQEYQCPIGCSADQCNN